MSNIFSAINAEAARQQQQAQQAKVKAAEPVEKESASSPVLSKPAPKKTKSVKDQPQKKRVAPPSSTTAPRLDTTAPHLEADKLVTVIRELSQLPTNSNALNVRLSRQESKDIDDFIHDKLRKRGIKGYEVSASKLLRYAFRYLSRVHEEEFIAALDAAFQTDETLSI